MFQKREFCKPCSGAPDTKLTSALTVTFVLTRSILILIDYLPAEVYTKIFPLSSLSLTHLFILLLSIINSLTLFVAAVTLFQCSCCQVNFLGSLVVTLRFCEIAEKVFQAAVFRFNFFRTEQPGCL